MGGSKTTMAVAARYKLLCADERQTLSIVSSSKHGRPLPLPSAHSPCLPASTLLLFSIRPAPALPSMTKFRNTRLHSPMHTTSYYKYYLLVLYVKAFRANPVT